ncbi:MAG: hypothetical protein H7Y32_20305 [Chloroflexales bacterium]|nr:hypothetical protein [Chloroflexales bacterium]
MHMFTRALLVGLLALIVLAGCASDSPAVPTGATSPPAAPAGTTAQPGEGAYPVPTLDPTTAAYPSPAQ